MTVEVGNIYNTRIGSIFQVTEVKDSLVTLINVRTHQLSDCFVNVIDENFVLVGKPYKEIDRTK